MKPSILLAAGCSWTVGKNVDPKFTFAQQLQHKLGINQFCSLAKNGCNNTTQLQQITNFINDNSNQYSKIFVLWGLTSIYRWEMYSTTTNQVEECMVGKDFSDSELGKEIKYYFSHFFNADYELSKLGKQIILLNGYLKSLEIDHLIFNSFQGYNDKDLQINDIDQNYFYQVKEKNNDMLSFLCRVSNTKISTSKLPWLNLARNSADEQFNNSSIKELQSAGLLDTVDAHPTVQAHELIAEELYDYIKEKNNERI
jgi:predicted unusual protein kinase regulating ubiquinone biosynthesis (AarF/ABC1/UbiB family)